MIDYQHTAACGGRKDSCAFYIDHLTPAQLRRRAADSRADALALAGRLSVGAAAMLLSDAARCELRASMLELDGWPSSRAFQKVDDERRSVA